MSEQLKGFGYVSDEDESLKSSGGGKAWFLFGLNSGCFVTEIFHNPHAGKDNAVLDALEVAIKIGEKEQRLRVFEVTRVFGKNKELLVDKTSDEYIKKYNEAVNQVSGTCNHILKAIGVNDELLKQTLKQPFRSFGDYIKVITSLVPNGYQNNPMDVFLEYQWNISAGQSKTYLQIPPNMKGGRWLCKSVEPKGGKWIEQREWQTATASLKIETRKGLRYIDAAENIHPFVRDEEYMKSEKANQQIDETKESRGGRAEYMKLPNMNIPPMPSFTGGKNTGAAATWE